MSFISHGLILFCVHWSTTLVNTHHISCSLLDSLLLIGFVSLSILILSGRYAELRR